MKKKTPHDGNRCRFTAEYVNHHSNQEIRHERAKACGTISGKDDNGNWLVRWDGASEDIAWSPNCIEIESGKDGRVG